MIPENPPEHHTPWPARAPGASPCLTGTTQDRIEAIVRRCGGGRLVGREWHVRCPAHDDTSPSLSLRGEGERVLLRCWAGCTAAAICAAIAIHERDLFADTGPLPHRKPQRPPAMRMPPAGAADPVDLRFAVDFVVDDVNMLSLDGLVTVLRQAAPDPLQWLWVEQQFHQHGMSPAVVWQVLYPETACPYPPLPPAAPREPSVSTHGRQSREEPSQDAKAALLLTERIVRDPTWIETCAPARAQVWALAQASPPIRAALTKALVTARLNPSTFWAQLASEYGG